MYLWQLILTYSDSLFHVEAQRFSPDSVSSMDQLTIVPVRKFDSLSLGKTLSDVWGSWACFDEAASWCRPTCPVCEVGCVDWTVLSRRWSTLGELWSCRELHHLTVSINSHTILCASPSGTQLIGQPGPSFAVPTEQADTLCSINQFRRDTV